MRVKVKWGFLNLTLTRLRGVFFLLRTRRKKNCEAKLSDTAQEKSTIRSNLCSAFKE